jgi:hypothetical protein
MGTQCVFTDVGSEVFKHRCDELGGCLRKLTGKATTAAVPVLDQAGRSSTGKK